MVGDGAALRIDRHCEVIVVTIALWIHIKVCRLKSLSSTSVALAQQFGGFSCWILQFWTMSHCRKKCCLEKMFNFCNWPATFCFYIRVDYNTQKNVWKAFQHATCTLSSTFKNVLFSLSLQGMSFTNTSPLVLPTRGRKASFHFCSLEICRSLS